MKGGVHLGIRGRLLFGFSSVIVLFMIASGLYISTALKTAESIRRMDLEIMPQMVAFIRWQLDTIKIQQSMSYAAASGDSSRTEAAEEYYQDAVDILNGFMKDPSIASQPGMKEKLKLIGDELELYCQLGLQMVYSYVSSGAEVGNTLMERFNPAAEAIEASVSALVDDYNLRLAKEHEMLRARMNAAIFISLVSVLISAIVGIAYALFFSNSLAKRTARIVALSRLLKEGDLTGAAEVATRDEIGLLAENLNSAVLSLRTFANSVKTVAEANKNESALLSEKIDVTLSSAGKIAATTTDMRGQFASLVDTAQLSARTVDAIFTNISAFTEQVHDQAAAVAQSSASIEEISASLRNVDRVISEKRVLATRLSDITRDGGEKVKATGEGMANIAKSIHAISDLIGIIEDVSERTNLLAMNAAIEAAHAGQSGKGFAVVADEIRKLAVSTGGSVTQISATLNSLIGEIAAASKSSSLSGLAFEKISGEVQQMIDAFDEIAGNSSQLAAGSNDITQTMVALMDITEKIKDGSEALHTEADGIHLSLRSISSASTDSLRDLKRIEEQTATMNDSIGEISQSSNRNLAEINTLGERMAVFKTDQE